MILAGVSINTVLGDDGIIKKAKEAAAATKQASAEEILEKIQKTIDNILNIKKFSKNVCKEFVDKIVIYNDKKFDFYLKGYDTSFNFNEESNISYLPH